MGYGARSSNQSLVWKKQSCAMQEENVHDHVLLMPGLRQNREVDVLTTSRPSFFSCLPAQAFYFIRPTAS